ncbi:lipase family protein [Nocardioides sp. WV_118_6]|uniref:lipase family protein n=1 Tax=Nocardioides simplex TaxID=2045 RepID=UPI00214F7A5C|nr:lipase family protein [Pimelobacter simplex]UUW90608.1 lipase family protein [Pimelobacter simplex]UUW94437.1 lipase family protein [Pimelobacter simplex]
MNRALRRIAAAGATAVLLLATAPVTAAGPRPGPRPGTLLDTSAAGRTSQVAGAGRVVEVRYTTSTAAGRVVPATGLVLVPRGRAPKAGWPLVVYGHMTTGIADRCAPTNGTPGHPELRRMQQGDDLTRSLLAAGVAVARPDYEGLGTPGAHPYLRGASLGRSMVDLVAATRTLVPLNGRWVASGHSEGGVAALNVADRRRPLVPGMRLMGVHAITPVTQMEVLVRTLRPLPVAVAPLTGELVALAALIIKGQAVEDPAVQRLALDGGLSPRARALWNQLDQRCLAELAAPDSWGGLAPARLLGPRGNELVRVVTTQLAQDDVRRLRLRPLPVRIEEGLVDAVAPFVFTEQLVRSYRRQGLDVTLGRWLAGHSETNSASYSVGAATAWILAQLRR